VHVTVARPVASILEDNTPAGQNRCSVWQPGSWRRRSQQHRSSVERLIPLPSCMSWLSCSDSGFPHPLRKTSRGNLQALRWIGRPSPRRKLLRSRTGFQEPRESALRRCYSNRATINCGLGDLVNSRAFIAADRILNISNPKYKVVSKSELILRPRSELLKPLQCPFRVLASLCPSRIALRGGFASLTPALQAMLSVSSGASHAIGLIAATSRQGIAPLRS